MVTFKTGGAPFWIEEGRYTLTLYDISEEQSGIDFGHGLQPRNKWIFSPVVNAAGETMERDDGLPLEYFEFTGQSIGPKSNARPMIEALLGKSIDGMTGEAVYAEVAVGLGAAGSSKLAVSAMIADSIRQDGETVSRVVKGSWKPVGALARRPAAAPASR